VKPATGGPTVEIGSPGRGPPVAQPLDRRRIPMNRRIPNRNLAKTFLVAAILVFATAGAEAQKVVEPDRVEGYQEAEAESPTAEFLALSLQAAGAAVDDDQATGGSGNLVQQMIEERIEAKAEKKAKKAAEKEAESRFLKFGFSFGLGVSVDLDGGDRVDEAVLDENGIVRVKKESNEVPRLFLETHYFFEGKQKYYIAGGSECEAGTTDEPCHDKRLPATWGHGPFVGIQSSDDEVLDAFALGWMFGFRRNGVTTTSDNSFNLGVGLLIDRRVKTLGDGIVANQPLPTGETEIRLKEESRLGAVVVASFSF
jgi:hypothetical protein